MCEYLGRTEYSTPILHCLQWGNIKWKPPYVYTLMGSRELTFMGLESRAVSAYETKLIGFFSITHYIQSLPDATPFDL